VDRIGPASHDCRRGPDLETFFLSHKYGRPKDVDHAPDWSPIVFILQFEQPGEYGTLAHPAGPAVEAKVIAHQQSLPVGIPPDLPRGATDASGHGGDDPGPRDEGEKVLVMVRG
jgi:hypothetical protein